MQTLGRAPSQRSTKLEHAIMRRVPALHPFDLLQARFISHRFAPHAHETYAIGVCTEGRVAVRHRGARHVMGVGDLLLMNPGEMHTGEPDGTDGWTYRMIYPGLETLRGAANALRRRPGPAPVLPAPVVRDPLLATRANAMLRVLASGEDPLEGECLLAGFLDALLGRTDLVGKRTAPLRGLNPRISRVRDYLHAHFAHPVSIADLAEVAQLSSFHLIRLFGAKIGLPPYMYLEHLRVVRAKELLARGTSLVDTAAQTGFGDQSHFTRRFKLVVGMPPGRYARQVLRN